MYRLRIYNCLTPELCTYWDLKCIAIVYEHKNNTYKTEVIGYNFSFFEVRVKQMASGQEVQNFTYLFSSKRSQSGISPKEEY